MQAGFHEVDMLRPWWVKLNNGLSGQPKQIFDEAHFLPGRAAVGQRNAHVLPGRYFFVTIGRDDPQIGTFMSDVKITPHRIARRRAERRMHFAGGFELAGWSLTHVIPRLVLAVQAASVAYTASD